MTHQLKVTQAAQALYSLEQLPCESSAAARDTSSKRNGRSEPVPKVDEGKDRNRRIGWSGCGRYGRYLVLF